jgi:prevent-host-death family protein
MTPKPKSMVHRIPITKARINLGQVVRRVVRNKEYFILEKDGIPVAGIMGADELEDYLELRDPMVKRFIQKSHREYLAGKSRPAPALLAELRRQRSGTPKKANKRAEA